MVCLNTKSYPLFDLCGAILLRNKTSKEDTVMIGAKDNEELSALHII